MEAPVVAALLDVVRDEFGRVAYTHKTHQKMIDRLNSRMLWEKRLSAGLSAITAGNTIGALVSDARLAGIVAVIASALALLLTVYGLSRARERLVEQHRLAAQALWLLRERYLHLICDLKAGAITAEDARAKRDQLTNEAAHVYASAPDTNAKAYAAAQKALRRDEELAFSPAELDAMLPLALRETSKETQSK